MQTPDGIIRRNAFSPGGDRDQNFTHELKGGAEDLIGPIELRALFALHPGEVYFADVVYEERQPDGWRGRIRSNKVRFELR